MITEHKSERTYANWKLKGKFYELSFTSEDGKIQNLWLSLINNSRGETAYSTPNSLGSINIHQLEDLNEIVTKALQIIESEGLNITTDDEPDILEEVTELGTK